VGIGTPRNRCGQNAMEPSTIISRKMPTSINDCDVKSSPRRTRAPKRSITSSSAPNLIASAQLALCVRAS